MTGTFDMLGRAAMDMKPTSETTSAIVTETSRQATMVAAAVETIDASSAVPVGAAR